MTRISSSSSALPSRGLYSLVLELLVLGLTATVNGPEGRINLNNVHHYHHHRQRRPAVFRRAWGVVPVPSSTSSSSSTVISSIRGGEESSYDPRQQNDPQQHLPQGDDNQRYHPHQPQQSENDDIFDDQEGDDNADRHNDGVDHDELDSLLRDLSGMDKNADEDDLSPQSMAGDSQPRDPSSQYPSHYHHQSQDPYNSNNDEQHTYSSPSYSSSTEQYHQQQHQPYQSYSDQYNPYQQQRPHFPPPPGQSYHGSQQQQQQQRPPPPPPSFPGNAGNNGRPYSQQSSNTYPPRLPDPYDSRTTNGSGSSVQSQQSPPPLPDDDGNGNPMSMFDDPLSQQHSPPLLPTAHNPRGHYHPNMDDELGMPSSMSGPIGFDENDIDDEEGSSNKSDLDLAEFDKQYILRGLAKIYKKKILPLELSSRYALFHSPPLSNADFDAPPLVLLLGQYSVGKTSFIKYLVGRDFPGMRVGPEPTTDRFNAVLWGPSDKIVPGAALATQKDRPFKGLSPFGNNFLMRLEGVEMDSPVLRNVTLVDSPGILSGQKQRGRNYDYESVMKWFGERADLVIVMFDAHKLDISDELKDVMELFITHNDKVRIVLNKADAVSTQQLMRVYGALMWQLGKVMNTPEVARVYMGSFWDAPLKNTDQAELLQREEMDLLTEIENLPSQAVMRRMNELVKRSRSVKVHAYIIHYLRKQLPYTWGKKEKQRRLIARLEQEFNACARRYNLPKGDFPPIGPMRKALMEIKDLSEFPKLDKKMIREMDKIFNKDIPELLDKARKQR